MNRTDRLYAIVEELRAVAPRPRSATRLAAHFEVSVRTIERDISALQQSGVPIWAEPGRTGGYCLDPALSLPPVNLTPDEAVAMAVGLRLLDDTPFRAAARAGLRKVLAAMQDDDAQDARDLAERVHLLGGGGAAGAAGRTGVPDALASALSTGRVLRIEYTDKVGTTSKRDVEPLGYVGKPPEWFLIAWCRLRDGVRAFRVDRIGGVAVTAETPEPRILRPSDLEIPYGDLTGLNLS